VGQEYDRSVRDVLSLQDEIARAVADEIQVKLTLQERARLSRPRPVNPEALGDYLRGRSILAGNTGHLSKACEQKDNTLSRTFRAAIAYFKSAIDKDPAYAQAHTRDSPTPISTWGTRFGEAYSPKGSLSEARRGGHGMALKLDPSLPEAHFSLAQTLRDDWNWPEAEKEYKLALHAQSQLRWSPFGVRAIRSGFGTKR
jgi:tetratricopeptide (TPR) repeat protein